MSDEEFQENLISLLDSIDTSLYYLSLWSRCKFYLFVFSFLVLFCVFIWYLASIVS